MQQFLTTAWFINYVNNQTYNRTKLPLKIVTDFYCRR